MQGSVATGIYMPEFLERRPVHIAEAAARVVAAPSNTEPAALPMEDEQVVLDRLRELGYIE
jgi:hypothetical protein